MIKDASVIVLYASKAFAFITGTLIIFFVLSAACLYEAVSGWSLGCAQGRKMSLGYWRHKGQCPGLTTRHCTYFRLVQNAL